MKLSRRQFIEFLAYNGACDRSLVWIAKQKRKTPEQLWSMCDRPKWLYWLTRILVRPNDTSRYSTTHETAYAGLVKTIYAPNAKDTPSHYRSKRIAESFRACTPWKMVERRIAVSYNKMEKAAAWFQSKLREVRRVMA